MSENGNDIYDWPLDWFGTHRAYRVDRALRTTRQQLSSLLSTKNPPVLLFEAAVLHDNPKTAHNTTIILPYDKAPSCAEILKSGAFLGDVKKFLTDNSEPISSIFGSDWLSRAKQDFESSASDEPLLRRRFDRVVGLVTRIPMRGYIHKLLCDHYFNAAPESRPSWYTLRVAKAASGKTFGNVTANFGKATNAFEDQPQEPDGDGPLSKADGPLMSKLLPVVTLHQTQPNYPELDLLAVPLHTIHEWDKPSYGTFLGWIYALRAKGSTPDSDAATLKALWPLLDQFAAELIEGEISDYFGHYHADKPPRDELPNAISRLSGWEVCKDTSGELDNTSFARWKDSALHVQIGELGSNDIIVLKPKEITILPPQTDPVFDFAIKRLAHRVRRVYRAISALFQMAESSRLRKYEQMLQLLQSPLAELSRSIGTMQSETQELRAVLYDPAQTIFASSFVLRELFDEQSVIEVSPSIRFITAHEPLRYSVKHKRFTQDRKQEVELSTEAGMICAIEAVCRIFGIERNLRAAHDLQELRLLAKIALKKAKLPAFEELTKDVLWLAGKGDRDDIVEFPDFDWDKHLKVFLENLKDVAFTPFKVDAESWHPRAIELVLRPWKVTPTYHEGEAAASGVVQFSKFAGRSPLPYSALLDFLIKLSSSKSSRKPVQCLVCSKGEKDKKQYTIIVTFSESFNADEKAIERLRNLTAPVLAGLREWRLHGSALGNWQAPFVEMSNRLLGIVERPTPPSAIPAGCWCAATDTIEKDMILSLENSLKQKFNIRMQDQPTQQGRLTIEWQ